MFALTLFPMQYVSSAAPASLVDGVHLLRAAQIASINANATVRWRAAAHPRFASLAPGASRPSNGVLGDWAAGVRAAISNGDIDRFVDDANAETIPDAFDSALNWPACAKSACSSSPSLLILLLVLPPAAASRRRASRALKRLQPTHG